jgi:hypothetical protein
VGIRPQRRCEGGGGLDLGHDVCGVGHWMGMGARRRGGGSGGSTGAERGMTAGVGVVINQLSSVWW